MGGKAKWGHWGLHARGQETVRGDEALTTSPNRISSSCATRPCSKSGEVGLGQLGGREGTVVVGAPAPHRAAELAQNTGRPRGGLRA